MLQESSTNTDRHIDLDRNELRLEPHFQLVPYSPLHHASSSSAYGQIAGVALAIWSPGPVLWTQFLAIKGSATVSEARRTDALLAGPK